MVLTSSENRPDPKSSDKTGQKVDSGFFREQDAPTDGRPHWASQVVPVEFKNRKRGDRLDPLDDKGRNFESQAKTRKEVRGQVTTYSELVFEHQHRVFLITVVVIGRQYRLMRWDRAGVISTPSVDYYDNPDDLCEFLWRISHLDDEALGIDPTAIRLQGSDFDELDAVAKRGDWKVDHKPRVLKDDELLTDNFNFKYVRDMFAESIKDKKLPRYKLQISSGGQVLHFLVGKAAVVTAGMAGRGTRCWVAWYCEGSRFVWLKDSWRISFEDVEKEGDILARFNSVQIPGVPTLVCHGDVASQITLTADWWKYKRAQASAAAAPVPASTSDDTRELKRKREDDPDGPSTPAAAQSPPRRGPRRSCRKSTTKRAPRTNARARKPTAKAKAPIQLSSPGPIVYSPDCRFRHHHHYRMAVAEVGMPLEAFTSGHQLASIILDCIIGEFIIVQDVWLPWLKHYAAHEHAATNSKLAVRVLHRDVSDKNIVIYPRISLSPEGERSLIWGGLLTDWEISKPIVGPNIQPKARQPERSVGRLIV